LLDKETVIKRLRKFVGQDLYSLAAEFGVTTFLNGKQNKGWKGHVLEHLAGLGTSSAQTPNGGSFELKSVSFYAPKGVSIPKETMAITMINPDELRSQEFFHSHCWNKLRSMVFCKVMWHGKHVPKAELLEVSDFNFSEDDELVLEIKEDYDFIRRKLIIQGFNSLTGKDGIWIQARTKGRGHGSITRAFYAKKELIKRIFSGEKG
jgi:DNA mismatch repair protein MutH